MTKLFHKAGLRPIGYNEKKVHENLPHNQTIVGQSWLFRVPLWLLFVTYSFTVMADPGALRFQESLIMDNFGYAYGIATADLDKDGDLDLTAADADGCALYWFENDGHGKFKRHYVQKDHPKPRLERHAIGDINGNGWSDIVIVENLTGDLYWFENNGMPADGKLWLLHEITMGGMSNAYDVALADFNGDGKLDVAATEWRGNEVAWFENPGTVNGKWVKHLLDGSFGESRTIRVADFDQDGDPDLLATAAVDNLVAWYENPGGKATGAWTKHIIDDSTVRPMHGQPVDMDGDGDMDVVMASGMSTSTGMVVWYENTGKLAEGKWKRHVIFDLPDAFEAVAADLNGDQRVEVVATTWAVNGGLYLFTRDENDSSLWRKEALKENWTRANQVIVSDMDGDGRPDIIAEAERGSNDLRWWRNIP